MVKPEEINEYVREVSSIYEVSEGLQSQAPLPVVLISTRVLLGDTLVPEIIIIIIILMIMIVITG